MNDQTTLDDYDDEEGRDLQHYPHGWFVGLAMLIITGLAIGLVIGMYLLMLMRSAPLP